MRRNDDVLPEVFRTYQNLKKQVERINDAVAAGSGSTGSHHPTRDREYRSQAKDSKNFSSSSQRGGHRSTTRYNEDDSEDSDVIPPPHRSVRLPTSSSSSLRPPQQAHYDTYEARSDTPNHSNSSYTTATAPSSHNASHHTARDPSSSASVSTSKQSKPVYQSRLGQKWGPRFEAVERAMLVTPALPQDAEREEEQSEFRSQQLKKGSAALLHSSSSEEHRRPLQDSNENDDSSRPQYEMDALRSQSRELARLKVQLRDVEAAHAEELAALRLAHRREIDALESSMQEGKERVAAETYNRQLATFQTKEQLLQCDIDGLKAQGKQLQQELDSEKSKHASTLNDLRVALEQTQTLRKELQQTRHEADRSASDAVNQKRDLFSLQESLQQRELDLRNAKHRESLQTDEVHRLRAKLLQAEECLHMQDASSKEQIRRLEKEFAESNTQFELLLNEAAARIQKNEKWKGKYTQLKEQVTSITKETEAKITNFVSVVADLEAEVRKRDEELHLVRSEAARREFDLREERRSHSDLTEELRHRLAEQTAQLNVLRADQEAQREAADAEAQRLQQELQNVSQRLRNREHELEMKLETITMLEESLREQRETSQQVSLASDNKVKQAQDLVGAMRQQLQEKDRRLEEMAAAHLQPIAKLRQQLADERNKRAQLEQQLEGHRKMAKEAEEAARRELRREQLRHPPPAQRPPVIDAPVSDRSEPRHAPSSSTPSTAQAATERPDPPRDGGGARTSTSTGKPPQPQPTQRVRHHQDASPSTWTEETSQVAPLSVSRIEEDPTTTSVHRTTTGTLPSATDASVAGYEDRIRQLQLQSQDTVTRILEKQKDFWEKCVESVRSYPRTAKRVHSKRRSAERGEGVGATSSSDDSGSD